jgi:hypothetical protein
LDEIEWPTKVDTSCGRPQERPKKLKTNDGSNSNQSIGLDEEEEEAVGENERATLPMNNQQVKVIGNKWEKRRIVRDAAA